jgi:hypothetical protein
VGAAIISQGNSSIAEGHSVDIINYSCSLNRTSEALPGGVVVDLSPLLGFWVNTNKSTRGIARILLSARNYHLRVQAFGADMSDWGEVPATAFAANVISSKGVGFLAHSDFGSSDALLAAYLNKRILVVDCYKQFPSGNGRARCFLRDHFYEEGGESPLIV